MSLNGLRNGFICQKKNRAGIWIADEALVDISERVEVAEYGE